VVRFSPRACDRAPSDSSADSPASIDRRADDNSRASYAASNTTSGYTDTTPSHSDPTTGFSDSNCTRDLNADSAIDRDITRRNCFAHANPVSHSCDKRHGIPNADNNPKPNTGMLSI
jgi:hypothetical protein